MILKSLPCYLSARVLKPHWSCYEGKPCDQVEDPPCSGGTDNDRPSHHGKCCGSGATSRRSAVRRRPPKCWLGEGETVWKARTTCRPAKTLVRLGSDDNQFSHYCNHSVGSTLKQPRNAKRHVREKSGGYCGHCHCLLQLRNLTTKNLTIHQKLSTPTSLHTSGWRRAMGSGCN